MATKEATPTGSIHPKTLLVGVYAPGNQVGCPEYYYEEFLSLVNTLGLPYDGTLFMSLRSPDNNMFLTKGKLQELATLCEQDEYEMVIFSALLDPLQERNLVNALNCDVFDRERIILEIFKKSAHTSEGKIQVEMAEIDYFKTRIAGRGKDMAQQMGIIGTRGPGETAKEQLKRHFTEKLRQAKKRLERLERSRDVQRKQRVQSSTPLICIIGYTNSGKSSLLNRMTKSNILAEDKLFATLDTTTRELFVDGKKKALISDTVGFISQLPHNLVAAFKSTLDELAYASVLLHVVDISNPAWQSQVNVVYQTLEELGVEKPMIYVFNKIDKLEADQQEKLVAALGTYQPQVFVHTLDKEGVQPLVDLLRNYKLQGENHGS